MVSHLLQRLSGGELVVEERLYELVYDDLKVRAHGLMRRQPADHTLQTTALVHEAWLKLDMRGQLAVTSRAHFFRLAARAMRSVLVDHARARMADKRGGGASRPALDDSAVHVDGPSDLFLALDEALAKLVGVDADLAQVAELRLFAGLEHGEIAETLGVSSSTVERAWRLARGWLQHELDSEPRP